MKEIKFRLIKDGKIVGYEKHVLSCGTISILHTKSLDGIWRYIYPDYKYWIPHDDKEQHTGLKDKNGKDDFDGNIWEAEYRGKIHRFLHQKVLGCDGYEFEFKCLTGEVSSVHANVSEDGIIIDNIHENPELLKD